MRRTVKRISLPLNKGKSAEIRELVIAYARQKNWFLREFGTDKVFAGSKGAREIRDGLVKQKYASPWGLPQKYWRMALTDAWETLVKYWAALADVLRPKVGWSKGQVHYFRWVRCSPQRLATRNIPVPKAGAFKTLDVLIALQAGRRQL